MATNATPRLADCEQSDVRMFDTRVSELVDSFTDFGTFKHHRVLLKTRAARSIVQPYEPGSQLYARRISELNILVDELRELFAR